MNALINLEFPVAGSFLPADHGYHLYAAISRFFDTPRGGNWFHEAADLALLPVNGTYVPERRLRLDHSARFLLRLDSASIPRARASFMIRRRPSPVISTRSSNGLSTARRIQASIGTGSGASLMLNIGHCKTSAPCSDSRRANKASGISTHCAFFR